MSANEMNSSEDEVILWANLLDVDFEAEVEDLGGFRSDEKPIEESVIDDLNVTSVPLTSINKNQDLIKLFKGIMPKMQQEIINAFEDFIRESETRIFKEIHQLERDESTSS